MTSAGSSERAQPQPGPPPCWQHMWLWAFPWVGKRLCSPESILGWDLWSIPNRLWCAWLKTNTSSSWNFWDNSKLVKSSPPRPLRRPWDESAGRQVYVHFQDPSPNHFGHGRWHVRPRGNPRSWSPSLRRCYRWSSQSPTSNLLPMWASPTGGVQATPVLREMSTLAAHGLEAGSLTWRPQTNQLSGGFNSKFNRTNVHGLLLMVTLPEE